MSDDTEEKKVITRAQAKALGLSRYFTGKPCKHGHVAERYTVNLHCVECASIRMAKYHENNKERNNIRSRKWAKDNVEIVRKRIQIWRKNNREKIKKLKLKNPGNKNVRQKIWRNNNRERALEKERLWRKNNPLKVRAKRAAGKARRRNAEGRYTANDILNLIQKQNCKCKWCLVSLEKGYHIDHIKPLSKGGSNWPSNLQLLCAPCNLSKGDKDMEAWALEQMW